jgi:hypothetical protein
MEPEEIPPTANADPDEESVRRKAGRDPDRIQSLPSDFPRLGPVGAKIFCREAQAVWPELRPALDGKALDGARRLGLLTEPAELAGLVPEDQLVPLAAALVRAALNTNLSAEVRL